MSGKSVLISYFFGDDMIPLGKSCANAFRHFGYDVRCFNSQVESELEQAFLKPVNRVVGAFSRKREIGKSLPISKVNFKKQAIKKAVLEFRPKWIFVIRAHEFVDEELVHDLHNCGVEKVFAWRVDGPLDTGDLLDDAKIYDAYFSSHRHGYDEQSDRICHLPVYAIDVSLYPNRHVDSPRKYQRDIVLVAGQNPRRQSFVDELLDLPLEIYGKWGKRNRFNFALKRHVKARGAWGDALLDIYDTSKIVLNITGWDPTRHSGLNQRVFDVPSTGAFLLTDYSPELEEHFRVGEEIVCFSDMEELREKALYFLAHNAHRETIARKGYQRALTLPTIMDRMRTIIEHVSAA